MRFLCDMGVSRKVSQWLCGQGHESTHLGDEGLARLPNGAIFSKAVVENRVVLTFDMDFGEIVALASGRTPSVVVFRLHNARADHVIERLAVALDISLEALKKGANVVVEESRIRIRVLPVRENET
jgi:predicted nuclease of predicted toxin-antitoxin system